MLRTRPRRWALAAFTLHAAFVLLVQVVDRYSIITLRNLHEFIVDRPAYEFWWWLQNSYPGTLADLTFPIARVIGLQLFSDLSWFAWCVCLGAVPYVVIAAILGQVQDGRENSRNVTQGSNHVAESRVDGA